MENNIIVIATLFVQLVWIGSDLSFNWLFNILKNLGGFDGLDKIIVCRIYNYYALKITTFAWLIKSEWEFSTNYAINLHLLHVNLFCKVDQYLLYIILF